MISEKCSKVLHFIKQESYLIEAKKNAEKCVL